MVEEHVIDLIPAYALSSLDENEMIQVARHLPHCPQCRAELETYLQTVDLLAYSVPLRQSPPDLKDKVLARVQPQVQSQPPYLEQSAQTAESGWQRLKNWFRSPAVVLGALALILIMGLGVSNLILSQQVSQFQASAPAGNMQVIPLTGTQSAPQAQGYLMVFANEPYGTLVVENAPVLDADHAYQLWLIQDGQRSNGGVLKVNEEGYGTLQVSADQPLNTYSAFGVTIEPASGSPGPTGSKVLGSGS